MKHYIKSKRTILALLGLLTLPMTGCGNLTVMSRDFLEQQTFSVSAEASAPPALSSEDISPSVSPDSYSGRQTPLYEEYSFYLPSMTQKERSNFLALYEGIINFQESIPLPSPASSDEVSDLMLLLGNECPELLQLDITWEQRSNLLGNVVSVSPSYTMDQEAYASRRAAVEQLLSRFHTQLEGYSSYEIELALYNYIIDNCLYSLDTPDCQNAYGALLSGQAKCDGRARALVWGLRSFGITSSLISGSNHAWVLVQIDGYCYNTDPTYDDSEAGGIQYPSPYAYFNVPESAISIDPYPADDFYQKRGYPSTVRWDSNYYVKNGLWIAAGQDAEGLFISQLENAASAGKGFIRLRFESEEDFSAVSLVYSDWIQQFLNRRGLSCSITAYDCSSMNILFLEITF